MRGTRCLLRRRTQQPASNFYLWHANTIVQLVVSRTLQFLCTTVHSHGHRRAGPDATFMKPATLDSPSPVKMRFGGLRIVAIRGSTSEYLLSPVSNSKRSTGQMIKPRSWKQPSMRQLTLLRLEEDGVEGRSVRCELGEQCAALGVHRPGERTVDQRLLSWRQQQLRPCHSL